MWLDWVSNLVRCATDCGVRPGEQEGTKVLSQKGKNGRKKCGSIPIHLKIKIKAYILKSM